MSIVIEKRTRALVTDAWGVWAETTDAAPYVNTDLVEYRVQSNTYIDIAQFTNGYIEESTESGAAVYNWEGTGIFDIIIKAANGNIKVEYDSGRINGSNYAAVYLGTLQSAMNLAMQFLLKEEQTEIQTDKAKEELLLALDSHDAKVALVENQASKLAEERKALIQSVIDNRKIKALDSLADTYGTFGAGGLTMSSDMWNVYFGLVSDLVSELNDYKGTWNATTNTPNISTIANPLPGDFYVVTVAGSTNLDGTSTWAVGDVVVFTAGIDGDTTNGYWKKSRVSLPTSTSVSRVS
jgi:hypothetical protein